MAPRLYTQGTEQPWPSIIRSSRALWPGMPQTISCIHRGVATAAPTIAALRLALRMRRCVSRSVTRSLAAGLSHRGTQHVDSHFMARFTAFRQSIRNRDFACKKFLSTKTVNGLWIDMCTVRRSVTVRQHDDETAQNLG